jgi:hypothetical protein
MTNDMQLGFNPPKEAEKDTAMQSTNEARAVAEVQSAYIIAKKFPRNSHQAYMDIIEACKRPFLAEQSMYAYPRGGSLITGPSIRLAEALAQCWGNLDCGVREISQSNGVSVAEAYAIDLQTNTRITKVFHVPHTRHTKKGITKLTDPRDIYESLANQGARRLRACILGLIPGDVIDSAVERCQHTLASSDVPIGEQVKKMILAFDELGVKVEHLEKRLGHNLDATIPQEIITLKAIYKSIKDGMGKREQFFDIVSNSSTESKNDLKEFLDKKKSKVDNKTDNIDKVDPETGQVLPDELQ